MYLSMITDVLVGEEQKRKNSSPNNKKKVEFGGVMEYPNVGYSQLITHSCSGLLLLLLRGISDPSVFVK